MLKYLHINRHRDCPDEMKTSIDSAIFNNYEPKLIVVKSNEIFEII